MFLALNCFNSMALLMASLFGAVCGVYVCEFAAGPIVGAVCGNHSELGAAMLP
jgi:hypothetical protein